VALVSTSVPLESIEPGMVLADPVSNRQGQILLNRGTTLSSRQINILKTWGIQSVVIQKEEIRVTDPLPDQEIRNQALDRIKKRLLWHPLSPVEEEIVNLAVEQVIQRSLKESR
jgi:hypothetical protein